MEKERVELLKSLMAWNNCVEDTDELRQQLRSMRIAKEEAARNRHVEERAKLIRLLTPVLNLKLSGTDLRKLAHGDEHDVVIAKVFCNAAIGGSLLDLVDYIYWHGIQNWTNTVWEAVKPLKN